VKCSGCIVQGSSGTAFGTILVDGGDLIGRAGQSKRNTMTGVEHITKGIAGYGGQLRRAE
jgi:hypothetical protein